MMSDHQHIAAAFDRDEDEGLVDKKKKEYLPAVEEELPAVQEHLPPVDEHLPPVDLI